MEFQDKFPHLFNHYIPIECDSGWKDIIEEACERLEEEIAKSIEAFPIEAQEEWGSGFYCLQIKEKFGGLRIYLCASTEKMDNIIEEASKKSYNTCEICGNAGKLRKEKSSWIRTLCEEHFREYEK